MQTNFKSKKEWIALRKHTSSLLLLIAIFSLPTFCLSHSGEHPHFKYSRESNEHFGEGNHNTNQYKHQTYNDHGGKKHDRAKIWLYSMTSTLFISAVPFFLLSVIPLDNTDEMRPRLKVLLAFASGGLLGDAFLHLIPHATNPCHNRGHSHDKSNGEGHHHDHDHGKHTVIGLWVLAGIIAFLTVEKLVRLLKSEENFSHEHSPRSIKKKNQAAKKSNKKKESIENTDIKLQTRKKSCKENMEIAGYLNLAADFAHNFTDGLAIGASFIAGNTIGVVTTITILLHEVPHEIGDFAILIKSGCSRRKAMLLQLLTAVGALSGNALAIAGVGLNDDTMPWVLPFTAGGFIYIATVSVLPELLEESTKLTQSVKEIFAILTGIILMVLISNIE